jgi:hypothetical protein
MLRPIDNARDVSNPQPSSKRSAEGPLFLLFVIVVVGAAIAATVIRDSHDMPYVDPSVVATLGLLGVTAFYAWQNHRMATAMADATELTRAQIKATEDSVDVARESVKATRESVETARAADLARQREVQILEIKPFAMPEIQPAMAFGAWHAPFSVALGGRTVLHLEVMVRGMGEARLGPDQSSDGRESEARGLGSWPADSRAHPSADVPLSKFMTVGGQPYEDLWHVRLSYEGTLGQRVSEYYEWRIRKQQDQVPGLNWQMRGFQIEFPAIPGAAMLDLTFGDD